jgi:predicted transcriptional regulator
MKLYKDIFQITENNIDFFIYLLTHPEFTTNEIGEVFSIKYQILNKYLKLWEKQGFIVREGIPNLELGGPKFKHRLSEMAVNKLKEIMEKLSAQL